MHGANVTPSWNLISLNASCNASHGKPLPDNANQNGQGTPDVAERQITAASNPLGWFYLVIWSRDAARAVRRKWITS